MSLEILQTILGTSVSYGILGKRATLKNNDLTISNNKMLNLVVVNENPPGSSQHVPPACFGGFDFSHDSVNKLVVPIHNRKVHYVKKWFLHSTCQTWKARTSNPVTADGELGQRTTIFASLTTSDYHWNLV
jgi:hypothetical protein